MSPIISAPTTKLHRAMGPGSDYHLAPPSIYSSGVIKTNTKKTGSPFLFGNPAVLAQRPVAFRPCLTTGLALSLIYKTYSI